MKKTWNGTAAVLALGGMLAGCSGGGPVPGSIQGMPSNSGSQSGTPSTPSTPSVPTTTRPAIATQPADASAITGASATFSVTATGTTPSYQWLRDGQPIAGATSSSYTVAAVTYKDEGAAFTVTVTNKAGGVTSLPAHLHLALSDDQKVFESAILGAGEGSHELIWHLAATGPQVAGPDYLYTDYAALTESPLTNGPQRVPQTAPVNLAKTLAVPAQPPRRVLKDGAILVVPDAQTTAVVTYAGASVRVDTLADDGQTVAWSQLRSGFSSPSLTGAVTAAPAEFTHWFNSLFANPGALDPVATYKAGAAYLKYTAVNAADDYRGFDCFTNHPTTGKDLYPCQTSSTLEAMLGPGWVSNSDGRTYHLADGAITTVGGVRIWVASAPRPIASTLTSTVKYRIYFQMGGNVYAGDLTKEGAVLGGTSWVSNPSGSTLVDQLTFTNYQVRLNRAARDSIAAAVTF
jgi:hypothetical protein